MLLGFPATIAMLYLPFPFAWLAIFAAVFFLFLLALFVGLAFAAGYGLGRVLL